MASFKVNFGGVWLTSNGLESGRACKLEIIGAPDVLAAAIGNTQIASNGQPFNESPLTPDGGGRVLEFQIAKLETSVFEQIKAILDGAAVPPGDEFNITASGEPGEFDVTVTPFLNPKYLDFGAFIDGNVKSVVARVITTAINAI